LAANVCHSPRVAAAGPTALEPTEGKGWIDLDEGILYGRPKGTWETKKRGPISVVGLAGKQGAALVVCCSAGAVLPSVEY
jgi:hypothetical protein